MHSTDAPNGGEAPGRQRLARDLHPGAWWIWALGLATAASRTTNPLVLGVLVAVAAFVVSARRGDAPWAKGFRAYLIMALVVIGIRVVFRTLFGGSPGAHVLFTLPEIALPEAAAGVRIGGPVSVEGLLAALYDGLRLAALLVCLGAANALANPKRLLKSVPGALYEVGVAITVALTVAPQLVESALRIGRARRLRGEQGRRVGWFRQVAMPVLTDALDRSLLLAAAMDSRGYGRRGAATRSARVGSATLLIVGLVGVCVGVYGLLDASSPRVLGAPLLVLGVLAAAAGIGASGRRVRRTRYRPDVWAWPEWGVAGAGVATAAVVSVAGAADPASLHPSLYPLDWPPLPLGAVLGVLIGTLPAVLAPPPARYDTGGPTDGPGAPADALSGGRSGRDTAALRGSPDPAGVR